MTKEEAIQQAQVTIGKYHAEIDELCKVLPRYVSLTAEEFELLILRTAVTILEQKLRR